MSRIGNRKLTIPAGVTVNLEDQTLIVKGPKGELKETFDKLIKIDINES
ncbi:MAG: 50S ribosomal protein L6, partial [Bacilli bacterium]|nr:50S ribosomal protein L6 [Bacilli bacterium]